MRQNQPILNKRQPKDLRESALGMISTSSFPAIVGTADMMLKSAAVTLVGYEKIGGGHCTAIVRGGIADVTLVGYEKIGGGHCTAIVRGGIADVRIAVQAGAETAEQFGQLISTSVISRPSANLDAILPIGSRLSQFINGGYSRLSNQSIGLLETRGFPAMVGAADMMLKSADVQLAAYETIGGGYCTAIVRGNVADVAVAIEAGMYEAERIGEFHTLMIIPRPLDDLEETLPVDKYWDLEETLPVDKYWIEQPTPVMVPIDIKEPMKELIRLPDLELRSIDDKKLL